jgi:hypothetical protein
MNAQHISENNCRSLLMYCSVILAVVFVLSGCSSSKTSNHDSSADTSSTESQVSSGAIQPHKQPTVVKDNSSLIAAIVTAIDSIDVLQFRIHLDLRTAIPAGSQESLAEPGQQIIAIPLYRKDEYGMVDMRDERNQRLGELRATKVGDSVFGTITLGHDGVWYFVDTKLF